MSDESHKPFPYDVVKVDLDEGDADLIASFWDRDRAIEYAAQSCEDERTARYEVWRVNYDVPDTGVETVWREGMATND